MGQPSVNRSSTERPDPLRLLLGGAGVAALVALAVWEGLQSRQSAAAHWSVGLVIVAAVVATLVVGHGAQRQTSRQWGRCIGRALLPRTEPAWRTDPRYAAGVVVWFVVIAAAIGWDLNSFVHQSPHLPTLSRFAGDVTRYHAGRAAFVAAWLGIGTYLVAGWRRGRR